MQCSIYKIFIIDCFHNVYFTTFRPTYRILICSKHPKRRPNTFKLWHFNSRFNLSIFEVLLILCCNSWRCIFHSAIVFTLGCNLHSTITYRNISVSIILLFVITPAPASCSYFIVPCVSVKRITIKLIWPNQFIIVCCFNSITKSKYRSNDRKCQ